MNMYLHELKSYSKSTMIWSCSMIGFMILFFSMFPAISNDAETFKKLLEAYPMAVRKALGISIDSFTSLLGFYSYVFSYILLCGSIQAMNLGTSIISKEVREKTADFLLTKPVTRAQILTAKLSAVFTSLVVTNVVYLISANIMAAVVKTKDYDMKIFLMISITLFFVQLMFLSLGVIVSVVVPKIKSVLPISLGTVFSFFIINMLGSVVGEEAIRYVTPFKYFETSYIIKNASYETNFIIIEIAFITAAVLASYFIYSKKDIHSV